MSLITKTIDVPATTREVVRATNCDICGGEIKEPERFDVDEITVERRTGTCYPSDNWSEYEEFDVCGDCWEEKVKPLFNWGPRIKKVDF